MARKQRSGEICVSGAKGGQNGAMVTIRRGFPFGPPAGKEKPGAGTVQVIYRLKQPWHVARRQDYPVKASVCLFPGLNIPGLIPGFCGLFRLIKNGRGEMRCRVPKCQNFKNGPHFSKLPDLFITETGNANAPAGFHHDQTLRFQPPKSLTNRHMAGAEFLGKMILPQPRPGLDLTGNNPARQFTTDPDSNGF